MLYLIDGYNVVKRDPSLRGMSLQEQREALERHLRLHAREVLGKGSYLVIWDGKGGEGVVRPSMTGRVKYTRMDTADDAIVAKVRSLDPRDQVTVFTSDNELANRCRSSALCKVTVLPSSRLFVDAPAKTAGGSGDASSSAGSKGGRKGKHAKRAKHAKVREAGSWEFDRGIPPNANKINEELKRVWGIED